MTRKLFPILMLVAIFAASCGNKPEKMIQKAWSLTDVQIEMAAQQEDTKAALEGATLTFKADGTYSYDLKNPEHSQNGTYSLNKEGTSLTMASESSSPETFSCVMTKTDLSLSQGGNNLKFIAK